MTRSIATRTGDDGTTSLLYGQRVPKHHPQVEAVGAFDEANTLLGAVKLSAGAGPRAEEIRGLLTNVQKNLVALMGELACAEADAARYGQSPFEKLGEADLARLDAALAGLEGRGLSFTGWATPGANSAALACDLARTAVRRAERCLSALPDHGRTVRPLLRQFVNRLSDWLWLLAREAETN